MKKCPKCGSRTMYGGASSGDILYCYKSAKLIGECDGKER